MKTTLPLLAMALLAGGTTQSRAALGDQLFAYYDFEQTGTAGLANKAAGAPGPAATRYGGGDFDSSAAPSGPGYTGSTAFPSSYGDTDRSVLLAGKALNLSDERNDAITVAAGTAELGNTFTISAWHYLASGATSPKTRHHLFECSDSFDVSWGTVSNSDVAYVGYLASGSTVSAPFLEKNQWHHITHVFQSDGTNTTLTVYADGLRAGSITALTSSVNFSALYFGRCRDGVGDRDWDGMVDEVAIWNRALSATEARELYHRGNAGIPVNTSLASLNKAYVDVSVSDPLLGIAQGSGIYNLLSSATLRVDPTYGYMFTSWTGALAGQTSPVTITVNGSSASVAQLGPDTRDPDGDGLSTYDEVFVHFTNPDLRDSDFDSIPDGDEINLSGTDPTVNDTDLVQYISNSVVNGTVANIGVASPRLTKNPVTGAVTLSVGFSSSPNGTTWTALPANAAGSAVRAVGNDFELTLPVSAQGPSAFRIVTRP